jgi:hypothetical protein
MKIRVDGTVLYISRLRRDGYRNVERVRLSNLLELLPSLRKAKVRSKMVGTRLIVQTTDLDQLLMPWMSESA